MQVFQVSNRSPVEVMKSRIEVRELNENLRVDMFDRNIQCTHFGWDLKEATSQFIVGRLDNRLINYVEKYFVG